MTEGTHVPAHHVVRPIRIDGERRQVLALEMGGASEAVGAEPFVSVAREAIARALEARAVVAYAFVRSSVAEQVFAELGMTSLGSFPTLRRPLRLASMAERLPLPLAVRAMLPRTALVLPFQRKPRPGVREITTEDPRFSRLWDRFSIDILAAVERNANFVNPRIFGAPDAGYRVFIFEDGDRYVIRALCIFRVVASDRGAPRGQVVELLHDRSVAGMRAASHLLGLALREMSDANAEAVEAWSLPQSGSFPLYARHAFLPAPGDLSFGVRALDPEVEPLVMARHHWYLSGIDLQSA